MRATMMAALLFAGSACARESALNIPDTYPVQVDPCERFEGRDDLYVFELYPEPENAFEAQFQGLTLRLPPEYVWREFGKAQRLASGNGAGAVGFDVRVPDFAPFGRVAPEEYGAGLMVLVTSYVPLDDEIALTQAADQLPSQAGVPQGLTLLLDENDDFDTKQVYFAYDENGMPTARITCRKVHAYVFGGCRQIMEGSDGIDIKIGYRMDHLPKWHEYGEGMQRFYDCMRGG